MKEIAPGVHIGDLTPISSDGVKKLEKIYKRVEYLDPLTTEYFEKFKQILREEIMAEEEKLIDLEDLKEQVLVDKEYLELLKDEERELYLLRTDHWRLEANYFNLLKNHQYLTQDGLVVVKGKNLDEAWYNMLCSLCEYGRFYKIDEGSYKGDYRIEFDFVTGQIDKPLNYTDSGVRLPLAVTVPEGTPAPTTDKDIENYFLNYLMDGNKLKEEDYRYSTFVVGGDYDIPNFTIPHPEVKENVIVYSSYTAVVPNQLEWCINHFRTKGFGNNHCCIQIGYPESNQAYDIPYSTEFGRKTSPCLRLIDLKIIKKDDGKYYLEAFVYFRSWDAYGGFPQNLGGIILLMEYIAASLGVEVGSLRFASKGLHVYGHSISALMSKVGFFGESDKIKELLKITAENK